MKLVPITIPYQFMASVAIVFLEVPLRHRFAGSCAAGTWPAKLTKFATLTVSCVGKCPSVGISLIADTTRGPASAPRSVGSKSFEYERFARAIRARAACIAHSPWAMQASTSSIAEKSSGYYSNRQHRIPMPPDSEVNIRAVLSGDSPTSNN